MTASPHGGASELGSRRLVLIDGTALIYRSHFAFLRNPLVNARGETTSAAYGVAGALLKLRRELRPDAVAFVLDSKGPTFRHERFAAYKATRERMPYELVAQIARVREVVSSFPMPILEVPGYEADDIMGTLARRGEAAGYEVLLVSGDKDLLQFVGDRIHALVPGRDGNSWSRVDADGVRERLGVFPDRVVDLLALMGDASDNVPGVPGIGAKTAVRVLEACGSLDAALAAPESAPGRSVQEALRTHRDAALLSRDLVTIPTDVPLDVSLDDLAARPVDARALRALFTALDFHRMASQLADDEEAAPASAAAPAEPASPAAPAARRPSAGARLAAGAAPAPALFDDPPAETASAPSAAHVARRTPGYHVAADAAALVAFAAAARAAGALALGTAATGQSPMSAGLVGLAMSLREGEAVYVPIGHAAGGNVPLDVVRTALGPLLADARVPKIGHDLKRDAIVLENHGLPLAGIRFDTMLASFLLQPERRSHGLDRLAVEVLGRVMTPSETLLGKGASARTIDCVAIEDAAESACEEADVAQRLRARFAPLLAERGLGPLFDEVEVPLVPVLARMERHGVSVDAARLRALSAAFEKEIDARVRDIHRIAGVPFNVNSTRELAEVLFRRLGLSPRRKTKTGFSTDQDVLEDLAAEHELPKKVLEYRQLAKLRSTYVETLPQLVNPRTGAIHTSFNQIGAATGRLSSTDPNLQNIPVRSALGREIRRAFVPRRPDWEMVSLDYSQIELRILAHVTADAGLTAAFREGADIHRRTAARVLGIPEASVDDAARDRAKAINFGIVYGMGAFGLASRLGIPREVARAFIADYFATYPHVKAWIDATIAEAKSRGVVTTLAGRIRAVPEISSSNRATQALGERLAVNTRIQGTAADLIKMAMIAVDRILVASGLEARMILTVHDELVFEGPPRALDAFLPRAAEAMRDAMPLSVPIDVHARRGPNWADLA